MFSTMKKAAYVELLLDSEPFPPPLPPVGRAEALGSAEEPVPLPFPPYPYGPPVPLAAAQVPVLMLIVLVTTFCASILVGPMTSPEIRPQSVNFMLVRWPIFGTRAPVD